MSHPILNRRILINGNKYFGSIIFFSDRNGRECLKINCKQKIRSSTLWRLSKLNQEKITLKYPKNDFVSLDISYKYRDSLLEIKEQQKGKFSEPVFVPVVLPPQVYLVVLRIKLNNLNVVIPKIEDIFLDSPHKSNEVAIFISFMGKDGKCFVDQNYMDKPGKIFFIDVPSKSKYNKLTIGITDDDLSQQEFDLTFQVPEYKNKNSIIPSRKYSVNN